MNIKKFLILFLFSCAPVVSYGAQYELPVPSGQEYVYFSAHELEYDPDAKITKLMGDVTLVVTRPEMQEAKIYSQNLIINTTQSSVSNTGDVKVEQGGNVLTGRDINYNYKTKNFKINDIKAEYPPIRVLHADSAESKDGVQKFKGARVTCCDQVDPHYFIKAGSASLSPQKRVFVTNALLYLGTVPVFYLPVMWRSLDSQKPFTTYVDFTQSNKTGFGLLTSTVFYPLEHLRTTINLDGYLKSGFGYGVQALVQDSKAVKGNVEAYAIDDLNEDEYRWGINGGVWARLFDNSDELNKTSGAIYQNQSQFRSVSDPYFNDTFFRSNPYQFMPDQDISVAFSRQSRVSVLRLNYSEKNVFNTFFNEYETIERTLPRLEYSIMPFTGPLGIVSNFSANVYNTQLYNQDYQMSSGLLWRSQRSFKLAKKLTFVPYVNFDERIVFEDPNENDDNSFVSRIGAGGNLRAELPTGSLDMSYSYQKRFSTGALTSDQVSPDGGEERNLIYIQNYYRPTPYLYLKLGTGYDLRNSIEEWAFDDRLEPLMAEAGLNTPGGEFNLFARNLYDFKDGNQSFIMQSDFKIFSASRLALGMTNYSTDINSYLLNTKLWFKPLGRSWYFDAGADFEIKQGKLDIYSKSVRLYKNFHDAHIEIGVVDRNKNLSFAFRFNVFCGAKRRGDEFSREDRYWTPWRSAGDLRD